MAKEHKHKTVKATVVGSTATECLTNSAESGEHKVLNNRFSGSLQCEAKKSAMRRVD